MERFSMTSSGGQVEKDPDAVSSVVVGNVQYPEEVATAVSRQLSPMYIQHEAIKAQKQMVNSPNHTVVYIPTGPMGVPITGTFEAGNPRLSARE